jgi:hypothetical protein
VKRSHDEGLVMRLAFWMKAMGGLRLYLGDEMGSLDVMTRDLMDFMWRMVVAGWFKSSAMYDAMRKVEVEIIRCHVSSNFGDVGGELNGGSR